MEMGAQLKPNKEIELDSDLGFLNPRIFSLGFCIGCFRAGEKNCGWLSLPIYFNLHNYPFSQPMHYFSNAYYR